jgi:hypothetical protein
MRGAAEFVKEKFQYPIVAVEVGVERGRNALDMLEHMNFSQLFLVDHYAPYADYLGGLCPQEIQDQVYITMFNNVKAFLDKVTLITRESRLASTLFPNEFFDFVYIDGNHNYDCVTKDIITWLPKVKSGCVLAGHDFDTRNITRQDVAEAVKDFFKDKYEIMIFPAEQLQFSDWAIIK